MMSRGISRVMQHYNDLFTVIKLTYKEGCALESGQQ